jgi:hypothetical protein
MDGQGGNGVLTGIPSHVQQSSTNTQSVSFTHSGSGETTVPPDPPIPAIPPEPPNPPIPLDEDTDEAEDDPPVFSVVTSGAHPVIAAKTPSTM